MKNSRGCRFVMLGLSAFAFHGCFSPDSILGLLSDCFSSDTISQRQFDNLNFFERALYEENDCGRYESRSGTLTDIF